MKTKHRSTVQVVSRHSMPFGAELLADDQVRFKLWAPAVERLELSLNNGASTELLPLTYVDDGWFELTTDKAAPGSRYCYLIDGDICVPDPASRFQPDDVHGPSEVIDPASFDWGNDTYRGRPWHEAVIYELHVGTFSERGDFRGVEERLDYLVELGVTAVELMPVADFPGTRDWGYDAVLPFAPDSSYGRPEDLKRLVRAAHERGLMMILDVVFNHFGPEGNYLHLYAPSFFTNRHHTPWGDALNFDGNDSHWVRWFFIHNALYWLEEYHFDGLRLDAVHAIYDESYPDILEVLAAAANAGPGTQRHIHLILENDKNAAHYLGRGYRAQWNDDLHHCLHLLLTGEADGYYRDYAKSPLQYLGRCLAEGFAYQGEVSEYRQGKCRGERSAYLPPIAFIGFLQNHDQVGNRAFGERLTELAEPDALRAATVLLLLSPQPPLLFMGQEWGAKRRFPFFCDFGPELANAVTEGRQNEFSHFEQFGDAIASPIIPDPKAEDTFYTARLDWSEMMNTEAHQWLNLHQELLALRQQEIVPLIKRIRGNAGRWQLLDGQGLAIGWQLDNGAELLLVANLSSRWLKHPSLWGRCLYATHGINAGQLPPWFVGWYLRGGSCE